MDKSILDALNINSITKELRKDSRSIRNRLQSIYSDYRWIQAVQDAYQRPLIPNERCGLWYVPPELRLDTTYFKSTDGHTTQWGFSVRRLNFHLFPLISSNNGIIIVDSTRRGKKMPDSLSKTIPIWCAVLNYLMFGPNEVNWLYTPPQTVSASETQQIRDLIPGLAKIVSDLDLISREKLLALLQNKPLRAIWIYPGLSLPYEVPEFEEFQPVICCTASHMVQDGMERKADWYYVQGAADDHELWAGKLTPGLFWSNREIFANTNLGDSELETITEELYLKSQETRAISQYPLDITELKGTNLRIGKIEQDIDYSSLKNDENNVDGLVILSELYKLMDYDETKNELVYAHYNIQSSKKGSKQLREILPKLISSISPLITAGKNITILCDTGKDLCVAVALVIVCSYYDLSWSQLETKNEKITKDLIRQQLSKISEQRKVNPNRATLQSINTYLM